MPRKSHIQAGLTGRYQGLRQSIVNAVGRHVGNAAVAVRVVVLGEEALAVGASVLD